jgi:hypothetical protein
LLATSERRRTLVADADAEARVAQDLGRLAAALDGELDTALVALVLIGTHARAEASVVMQHGEFASDSSYELLAILRSRSAVRHERLERLAISWSERLDARVQLHGCTRKEILGARPSLSWLEIGAGKYEILTGPAAALSALHPVHPKDLPSETAARLTRDAAVGLALSNLDALGRDRHGPRHAHHAVLLCGDALLLHASHFALDLRQRAAELARIATAHDQVQLSAAYDDAVRFQERPDLWRPTPDFARWYQQIRQCVQRLHLHLEASRVGSATDPLGYALFAGKLWPNTRFLSALSLRAALRSACAGNAARTSHAGDPEERSTRCAVLLGYAYERPEARRLAARLLGMDLGSTRTPNDVELLVRFRKLAEQVRAADSDPLSGARYGRD